MIMQSKFPIFFLSFNESNREKNWQILRSCFPRSRRIHGIKGLALAHQTCARLSKSSFFFVVNADNEILKNFKFEIPKQPLQKAVYVYRSLNPVNQLIYGFGGVKLFPRSVFFSSTPFSVDLSSSLRAPYKIVSQIASLTRFNATPLEAWRGAFRECAKLASQCISHQKTFETEKRLKIWSEKGKDQAFGSYVLMGAKQGREYGEKHKNNPRALLKINDFFWLEKRFRQSTRSLK